MKRFLLAASVCLCAGPSLSNEMRPAAERAFGNSQLFQDFTREKADEILAPEVHDELPQSNMNVGQLSEQGALIASDQHSVEGKTYSTLGEHLHNSTFAPADDSLDQADDVELDPEAIVASGTFSAGGGQCTVTSFEAAPSFTRTCDAMRQTQRLFCTYTPEPVFTYHLSYTRGGNPETGNCIDFSWPGADCTCTLEGSVENHSCTASTDPNDFFPQGFINPAFLNVTYALNTRYQCDGDISNPMCVQSSDGCTGAQNALLTNDPTDVFVECTQRTTEYVCPSTSYTDDCQLFKDDPSCNLAASDCYSTDADGMCGAFEYTYSCGGGTISDFDTQCDAINVCVAGVCDAVEQDPNDEIPQALLGIGLLNSVAADWNDLELESSGCLPGNDDASVDPSCFGIDQLDYFSSEVIGCRKAILATFNCCRDSGWALDVFTMCRDSEYILAAAIDAQRTVYVRTRCSQKVIFLCIEKTREHCVFKGRFGREVSYQGQQQLYSNFECRGLTHDEFARLDFSAIDLTPLFADLLDQIEELDVTALEDRIRSNAVLNAPQVSIANE